MFQLPSKDTEIAVTSIGVALCLTCLALLAVLDARRKDWIAVASWSFAGIAIGMSAFPLPVWAAVLSLVFSATAFLLMLLRIWRASRDPQWRQTWRR